MPNVDKIDVGKTTVGKMNVGKESVEKPNVSIYHGTESSLPDIAPNSLFKIKNYVPNANVESLDLEPDENDKGKVSKEYLSPMILASGEIPDPELFLKNYQSQLQKELRGAKGTRARSIVAAKFLSTEFPKLPYFWGGGHEKTIEELKGIDFSWGTRKKVTASGDDDYIVGKDYFYSLDCSGFVCWCLANGGYPLSNVKSSSELKKVGKTRSITEKNILNVVKPGDLAWMDKHIGIIIDVNKKSQEITIAHVSGSGGGMNVTTQSTVTGKITKDDVGTNYNINIKDGNGNPKAVESRVGNNYFTHIVSVPYPD